eukprot:scaffold15735_cov152-Amphora_coffeaeformis.AAC.14
MQLSDDDSDADERKTANGPRVTRLEQPSQVTVSRTGEIAIAQKEPAAKKISAAEKSDPTTSVPKKKGLPLTSPPSIPPSWTEKGGSTRVGNTTLMWTQDRAMVTLRFLIPADRCAKGWTVRIKGMLKYVDRKVGVTSDKPTLEIGQGDFVLLPPTPLPHPIHGLQDDIDDDDDEAFDWIIERSDEDTAYITVTLQKAAPMDGVVVWWNCPLQGADEIAMDWRSGASSSNFQQAWDEAHRQFREKMAEKKEEEG